MRFSKNCSILFVVASLLFQACGSTRPAAPNRPLPKPTTPTKPNNDKPPANNNGNNGGQPTPTKPNNNGNQPAQAQQSTYRLAVLLPFLANQVNAAAGEIPEKSKIALQYYAGMQLGLTEISQGKNYPNLVVDVLDTQASDTDFQYLINTNARLKQAQVIIGPVRNSHITAMANQIKTTKQILVSPESPSSDLTDQNPNFIQTNPPLRAHCSRIIQYLRSEKKRTADQVVLICKEKEADRLVYFQDANLKFGATALKEIILPDASTNFDKIDFKKYFKPGQITAFVMPSWAGQDWVVAFLSRLKQQKGSNKVEVYGMPQWADYEQIEPELLTDLNVHISSAQYINRTDGDVKAFEQAFYDKFGTLPNEDAFSGYDIIKFTALMLQKYGLNFPEKVSSAGTFYPSMTGGYYLRRVPIDPTRVTDAPTTVPYEYVENIYVHILKFEQFQFRVPAGD